MDVEGGDGRDGGGRLAQLAARFVASVADVIILNVWYHDLGAAAAHWRRGGGARHRSGRDGQRRHGARANSGGRRRDVGGARQQVGRGGIVAGERCVRFQGGDVAAHPTRRRRV
eukprot:ctg_5895.g554